MVEFPEQIVSINIKQTENVFNIYHRKKRETKNIPEGIIIVVVGDVDVVLVVVGDVDAVLVVVGDV